MVPVGWKCVCFPGFQLLILVQAPAGRSRRCALGVPPGWALVDPWAQEQQHSSQLCLGLQPLGSAGKFNPTIHIQENFPCSSAGFTLFETGVKAQPWEHQSGNLLTFLFLFLLLSLKDNSFEFFLTPATKAKSSRKKRY